MRTTLASAAHNPPTSKSFRQCNNLKVPSATSTMDSTRTFRNTFTMPTPQLMYQAYTKKGFSIRIMAWTTRKSLSHSILRQYLITNSSHRSHRLTPTILGRSVGVLDGAFSSLAASTDQFIYDGIFGSMSGRHVQSMGLARGLPYGHHGHQPSMMPPFQPP